MEVIPQVYAMSHRTINALSNYSVLHTSAVKPHELIKLLVDQLGGPSAVAHKMNDIGFQSTLHKFCNGNVASPRRATAERIAKHLGVPIDALYVPEVAAAVYRQRFGADPDRFVVAEPEPSTTYKFTLRTAQRRGSEAVNWPALRRFMAALPIDSRTVVGGLLLAWAQQPSAARKFEAAIIREIDQGSSKRREEA